jgi:hypothetical protein
MTYRIAYRLPLLSVVSRGGRPPWWLVAAVGLGARTDERFLEPSLSRSGGQW